MKQARAEYVEALHIFRQLAAKNPKDYQPHLGQAKEAHEEWSEALKIYESFAKKNPERFSADVTRVKKLLAKLPN